MRVACLDVKYRSNRWKFTPGYLQSEVVVRSQTAHVRAFASAATFFRHLATDTKKQATLLHRQSVLLGRKPAFTLVYFTSLETLSCSFQVFVASSTCSSDWKCFQRGPSDISTGPWLHAEHTRLPSGPSSPQTSRPHPAFLALLNDCPGVESWRLALGSDQPRRVLRPDAVPDTGVDAARSLSPGRSSAATGSRSSPAMR